MQASCQWAAAILFWSISSPSGLSIYLPPKIIQVRVIQFMFFINFNDWFFILNLTWKYLAKSQKRTTGRWEHWRECAWTKQFLQDMSKLYVLSELAVCHLTFKNYVHNCARFLICQCIILSGAGVINIWSYKHLDPVTEVWNEFKTVL